MEKTEIQTRREALGLSRAELSRQSGIPLRTLENWEAEVNRPPAWAQRLLLFWMDHNFRNPEE